jgi:signal transduction histidine kinase
VALREGQRLRSSDIAGDPRSIGFPPNHPPMRSLVAVPILGESRFRGNLYLAEKPGGERFTADDEETLARFATSAAITIDHAYLHQQLAALAVAQERLRIAHEMHDGLAQVLAYVNTKAQAVREFLRAGRADEAARQLDQLAGAAREVYGDVRESIIGLRGAAGADWRLAEALGEYVASWQLQAGVACQLRVDAGLHLPQAVELQLLRIVQEALANVRKHAQARRVEIDLQQRGPNLLLTVRDDGVGFKPLELGRSEFPRFGLATMRERAESIGGKLVVGSSPGGGTLIKLELPVPLPQPVAVGAANGRPY